MEGIGLVEMQRMGEMEERSALPGKRCSRRKCLTTEQVKWTRERSRWCFIWPRAVGTCQSPICVGLGDAFQFVQEVLEVLLRIVPQDALSEVMKVYPLMKLKVFRRRCHSFLGRTTQGSARHCRKVLRAMRLEVEEKGLILSITLQRFSVQL